MTLGKTSTFVNVFFSSRYSAHVADVNAAIELERTIESYNAAWNAHDVPAIVAFHAPDMVFELSLIHI